jgi:predicted nucleic acid-binding Zn ribbon protein
LTGSGGRDLSERALAAASDRRGGSPEAVGAILARMLRDPSLRPPRRGRGVEDVWARAAGPELAEETRAATLRQGVLTVEVRSAPLLAELAGFRSQELLGRVTAEDGAGRIRGLKFRLGVF